MAGLQSGPTPWWQLPGGQQSLPNLNTSAPAGYKYDPVQMKYVPEVSSASTLATDKARAQSMQDTLFQQEQQTYARQADLEQKRAQQQGQIGSTMTGALQGLQSFLQGAYNTPPPPVTPPSGSMNYDASGGSGGGAPSVAHVSMPDTSGVDSALAAKQNAAFGKAKATAGSLGRSAISSSLSELAGRGLSATGGAAARRIADQVARSTNPLADINVAQLGENAENARHNADTQADFAKTSYQGDIAQRGQDLSAKNAADANANAKASLSYQNSLAAAQMQQQKQMALASLITNAMTGITGAMGKLY